MIRRRAIASAALVGCLALSEPAVAQEPAAQETGAPETPAQEYTEAASDRLRVFIDCTFCDTDFLRQEITHVDYVRDRFLADVHVLFSIEGTGGARSTRRSKSSNF